MATPRTGIPTRWADTSTASSTARTGPSTSPPTAGSRSIRSTHLPTCPERDVGADKIQKDLQKKVGVQPGEVHGGGTVFTEPILVVNQKAKLIEVNNEYAIFDQNGNQIGAVRQVGQSKAKKAVRVLTQPTSS